LSYPVDVAAVQRAVSLAAGGAHAPLFLFVLYRTAVSLDLLFEIIEGP